MGAGEDGTVVHSDVSAGANVSNCDASVTRMGSEERGAISEWFRLLAWNLSNIRRVDVIIGRGGRGIVERLSGPSGAWRVPRVEGGQCRERQRFVEDYPWDRWVIYVLGCCGGDRQEWSVVVVLGSGVVDVADSIAGDEEFKDNAGLKNERRGLKSKI